jgi:hypothetical protein
MGRVEQKVKNKYPYLTSDEVTELVDNATGWFYALRYPCDLTASKETRPITTFMDEWCVNRLCDEIAERNGFNSALGYRENGVSFTFDGAWISESLKKAIVPIAGVV